MHGLIFETSICYWQDQPGCYPYCMCAVRRERLLLRKRAPPPHTHKTRDSVFFYKHQGFLFFNSFSACVCACLTTNAHSEKRIEFVFAFFLHVCVCETHFTARKENRERARFVYYLFRSLLACNGAFSKAAFLCDTFLMRQSLDALGSRTLRRGPEGSARAIFKVTRRPWYLA